MIPIILNPEKVSVALVGAGAGLNRRFEQLQEGGARGIRVYVTEGVVAEHMDGAIVTQGAPSKGELAGYQVVYVAGVSKAQAVELAALAHDAGALVNVEDQTRLCDFHLPAVVRRGDMLVTASTGGKSPGLARELRQYLERLFGSEWAGRTDQIGKARQGWIDDGCDSTTVAQHTQDMIEENGWLK